MHPLAFDTWVDRDAGPVVRPYAVTSGRTRSTATALDLISIVLTTGVPPSARIGLGPEAVEILRLAERSISVAEIAAYLDLPAGTIKVLLGDLLDLHLIHTRAPVPTAGRPNEPVLEAVIHGLRSL